MAQLSVAGCVALGVPLPRWALDHLVTAAVGTQREFGAIGPEATEAVSGPALDETSWRDVQARRFRKQAVRAASETVHFARQFASIGVDPAKIKLADIALLPLASKAELQAQPAAFVSRRRRPVLVARSTGTTGRPVEVAFSRRELDTFIGLSALGFLVSQEIRPGDVVYMAGGAESTSIAAYTLKRACERIGATCLPVAHVSTAAILLRLAGRRVGRTPTVLHGPPSLLGPHRHADDTQACRGPT